MWKINAEQRNLLRQKLHEIIETAANNKMDGVNIELNPFITAELIKKTHGRGLKFYSWTINDIETAKFLSAAGIDGITTDRPALLKAI